MSEVCKHEWAFPKDQAPVWLNTCKLCKCVANGWMIAELERCRAERDEAQNKLDFAKRSVSVLWDSVARGMHDSRSLVGDETLHLKGILWGTNEWPHLDDVARVRVELGRSREALGKIAAVVASVKEQYSSPFTEDIARLAESGLDR